MSESAFTQPGTPDVIPAAETAFQQFMANGPQSRNDIARAQPPLSPVRPTVAQTMKHSSEAAPTKPHHPHRNTAGDNVMPSLGILDSLLADSHINDILVNGTKSIFVDRGGLLEDSGKRFSTDEEVWDVAERIMDAVGQHWSTERPMIDTRLPDGSRVNIVAPPMAVDGVMISIRKFPAEGLTLDRMAQLGQISPELANFLGSCTHMRLNMIVAGATSSGKTTLLNALSSTISPRERIVTIEDCAELRLQQPHVVRLEAKAPIEPNKTHTAVSMRDLLRNALRMRPDRIILGECRGGEAFDVLQAMNTGHDGSMTTLHANTPRDALSRLETMLAIAMPHLTTRVVRQQIASTINLVLQTARDKDGTRRITHVSEIAGVEGDTIMMQDLVVYQDGTDGKPGQYRWVGGSSRNAIVTEAARNSGLLKFLR